MSVVKNKTAFDIRRIFNVSNFDNMFILLEFVLIWITLLS